MWIRLHPKPLKGVANIWNSLVKVFFIIGDWCAWKVGDEKKVLFGYDSWCGANNDWNLLEALIQSLRSKGINTLSDASSVIASDGKYGWKQA